MDELNHIMAGVDIGLNPRLSLIEHLILFVTIRQVTTENNDEYLDKFNSHQKT